MHRKKQEKKNISRSYLLQVIRVHERQVQRPSLGSREPCPAANRSPRSKPKPAEMVVFFLGYTMDIWLCYTMLHYVIRCYTMLYYVILLYSLRYTMFRYVYTMITMFGFNTVPGAVTFKTPAFSPWDDLVRGLFQPCLIPRGYPIDIPIYLLLKSH